MPTKTDAYLLSSAQQSVFELEDSTNIPDRGCPPQTWVLVLPLSHQHACLYHCVRYQKRSILANYEL
jgi:hypothetical protein